MTKRIIAAVLFLSVSLLVGILSYFSLVKGCDEMTALLGNALETVETGNPEAVTAECVRANAVWEKKKTLFHILLNHDEMSGIETDIREAKFFSENGDLRTARLYLESCRADFDHIRESVEPSLSNVF